MSIFTNSGTGKNIECIFIIISQMFYKKVTVIIGQICTNVLILAPSVWFHSKSYCLHILQLILKIELSSNEKKSVMLSTRTIWSVVQLLLPLLRFYIAEYYKYFYQFILQLALEIIKLSEEKNCHLFIKRKQQITDIISANNMNAFIYRMFHSSSDLRYGAIVQVEQTRKLRVSDASFILVPHLEGVYGEKRGSAPVTKHSIAERIAGEKRAKTGPDRDANFNNEFMQIAVDHGSFLDPELVDFKLMLPNGATLLDFLSLDAERDDGWDYPSAQEVKKWRDNRSLSYEWKRDVGVKEFIIGVSGDMDLCDVGSWFTYNHAKDQGNMPTGVVSLNVECIDITYFDLLRITSEAYHGVEFPLSAVLQQAKDLDQDIFQGKVDKWIKFPAKVMVGSYDWCIVLSFDIKWVDECYTFNSQGIPTGILDLLTDFPVVTGIGIREDVLMIEEIYSMIAGEPVTMQGFLELGTLATLAGWQLKNKDVTAMSIVTLGCTMNELCYRGDGAWGENYPILPESLQVYALGKVKFGYLTYGVLIALLFRQLFPDPDIVCKMSQCTQEEWSEWFYYWIKDTLVGTTLCKEAVDDAAMRGGRFELMMSIRYITRKGYISSTAPARIRLVSDLIAWPTLTQWGPRYLHPVRQLYLSQYEVLKASGGIPRITTFFTKDISLQDKMYATFGHLDIDQLDADVQIQEPVLAEFWFSMFPHPSLQKPLLDLDGPLTLSALHEAADDLNRGLYEAMLEWFRFDVDRLKKFFAACVQDEYLSKCHRGKYEDFRLLYLRVVNRSPRGIPDCDTSIDEEVEKAMVQERKHLEVLLSEVSLQQDILDGLERASSGKLGVNRFDWKNLPKPTLRKPPGPRGGPFKRDRSGSMSRLHRAAVPKRGRSQASRLEDLSGLLIGLDVAVVETFRESDECVDGGRRITELETVQPPPVVVDALLNLPSLNLPSSPVLAFDLDD